MELFSPNGSLYKVMWAAEGTAIIWNMQDNQHDSHCGELVRLLGQYIDVPKWAASYEAYYHSWLDDDDQTIYHLESPLLAIMLGAIKAFNEQEPWKLYYWFDIDRTDSPVFHWQHSPLSGEKLLKLPSSFASMNRYIAPTDFLVFPADFSL
jgi:hypothetical protein